MYEAAGMGVIQMGLNAAGNKNIAGMKRQSRKAEDRHRALMYELANKELDQSEKDLAQGDKDAALAINDNFNQRGDGEAHFVTGEAQSQDRRERDFTARQDALLRERTRLKSSYMTENEIRDISKRISKAQAQLNMMNAFLGGGLMGAGEYGASQNYQSGRIGLT